MLQNFYWVRAWVAAIGFSLSVSSLYAGPDSAAQSVQSRVAAQNELFKQQWNADMEAFPETATAYGDYRYNDRLNDRSLKAAELQYFVDRGYRDKLAAIATDGFPEQDQLSHDLLLSELDKRIRNYSLKEHEMPLSQMRGIQTELAQLPRLVPLDDLQHYRDYIARLHQVPRAIERTIAVLRQGTRDGLVPPQVLLKQVPAQCENIVADNPFLVPTKTYPVGISPEVSKQLTVEITQTVNAEVLPAIRRLGNFISNEYAPHGRTTIGMNSLPNGKELYKNAVREQTTTNMTAAQVHALGLREVERLNGLLTDLAHDAGYTDLRSFRLKLNTDPRYTPKDAEQIVDDFRHYVTQMQSSLPKLFGTVPTSPLTVEAMPPDQPGNISHYIPGTPDNSRPARVVVATSDYAHRKLFSNETIAYHEGIPGHHLQISIQQHLPGMQPFRLHMIFNAYAEGWAVYAETIGKEAGFFREPASDYGRLNTELMRAVRLVVDTGIHSEGWTRDQAVAYLRESGCADEPTVQAEVDRYIAWPAQGLSYKIGQLKILELRERAKQKLGVQFDLRAFHDEVLNAGSLPLDLLETRIDKWIANQLRK